MPKPTNSDDASTGRDDAVDTSTKNLEDSFDDDEGFSGGEEVDSRFEADSEDDSAATDEDDDDDSGFEDDAESEDDSAEADEEADASEEGDDTEEDDDSKDDAKVEDEGTLSDAERKKLNDEMAKARIAEREAKKEAETLRKQRETETLQRYIEEAGDDEIEREKRENDVERFKIQQEKADVNEERLDTEVDRALKDIDLFQTGSTAAKKELISAIEDFENRFVKYDKGGRPIEIGIDPETGKRASLYQHLQNKAASIKEIQGDGARTQGKSKTNQRRRAITPPSRAPAKPKVDADIEAFDEEAAK